MTSIYTSEGGLFVPSGHARSPWDPGQQHGGPPAALAVRAIEALAPEMQVARLTVEFFGTVPLEPLQVHAEISRPGRRMQLAWALLSLASGRGVARASAVLLHRQELDGIPAGTAGPPLPKLPEDGQLDEFETHGLDAFHSTGMEMRWIDSGWKRGPGTVWFRLAHAVVDDEEPSPAMRAAAAADFGNGVSQVLEWDDWLFINTDLTVQLHRQPEGEWVALDAHTIVEPNGVGLSVSTLYDTTGPVGTGQQTLYVAPR